MAIADSNKHAAVFSKCNVSHLQPTQQQATSTTEPDHDTEKGTNSTIQYIEIKPVFKLFQSTKSVAGLQFLSHKITPDVFFIIDK